MCYGLRIEGEQENWVLSISVTVRDGVLEHPATSNSS